MPSRPPLAIRIRDAVEEALKVANGVGAIVVAPNGVDIIINPMWVMERSRNIAQIVMGLLDEEAGR